MSDEQRGVAGKDRVRVGIGASEAESAAEAGRRAARTAVAGLAGEPAALVLVYGSVRYNLTGLLDEVRQVTGDTLLVGASTSGHFHDGAVTMPGRGVAVLAMTAGPYQIGAGSVTGLRADASGAGQALARAARRAAGPDHSPYAAMLLLADGMTGNQQELLAGMHKVIGAVVPVVGGAAADDRRLEGTSVLHGERVLTDGAVAVWFGSPWPLPVAADHGWQPVGLPLLVTKVDGNLVHEIAGRPAMEVLREHLGQEGYDREVGCVRRPGYHTAHAIGLVQPDGSLLIRGLYLDGGRLRTLCPLPTYAPVQIVSSRPDDLLSVVDGVVDRVRDGREPSLLLGFSCVARLDVLRNRGGQEAARFQAAASPAATFGFYTYGEFARTASVAGFHNATLAAIAL